MDQTRATLRSIIAESLGIDPAAVGDAQDIFTDLNGDDLDRLVIGLTVEEAFGLNLSDEQVQACRSLDYFAALVAKLTGASHVSA